MSEEMKKDVMETAEAVETAAPAETMDGGQAAGV